MGRVKKRHILKTMAIELGFCLMIGLIAGVAFLLSLMIPRGGIELKGVCDHVIGTGGLLPFNANEGGTVVNSCNSDWGYASFFVAYFTVVVGGILFLVARFVRLLFYIGLRMRRVTAGRLPITRQTG